MRGPRRLALPRAHAAGADHALVASLHAARRAADNGVMSLVRIAVERLLLLVFAIAQIGFLVQGLAMGSTLLAAPGLPADAPAWFATALRACLAVGATLFGSGLLLAVARRLPPPSSRAVLGASEEAQPIWALLLGITLLALPALAASGAAPLVSLWAEIGVALDQMGFWNELARAEAYAGLVVFPILVALFVPALETAAVFFLVAIPLVSIPLLFTRSRAFPRLLVMTVVCQVGLVLAGLLAAQAFSKVSTEAMAAMSDAGGADMQRAAEALGRARDVLTGCARAFVAPVVGYALWLPALLTSPGLRAYFADGSAREGQRPHPIRSRGW